MSSTELTFRSCVGKNEKPSLITFRTKNPNFGQGKLKQKLTANVLHKSPGVHEIEIYITLGQAPPLCLATKQSILLVKLGWSKLTFLFLSNWAFLVLPLI